MKNNQEHLKELKSIAIKLAKLEDTCDKIYSILNKQNLGVNRTLTIPDGPEG